MYTPQPGIVGAGSAVLALATMTIGAVGFNIDWIGARASTTEKVASRAWAGMDNVAWDKKLRAASVSASSRRRAQDTVVSREWKYDSSVLASTLDGVETAIVNPMDRCEDNLATNPDAHDSPCTYDCAVLKQALFPETPTDKFKCFVYDAQSQTWPEVSDPADELLSRREQQQDWHKCKP